MIIKIIGRPKSGKTTLALLIKWMLQDMEIETVIAGEDTIPEYLHSNWSERVKYFTRNNPSIEIVMDQETKDTDEQKKKTT